jgi:hypothetical protein
MADLAQTRALAANSPTKDAVTITVRVHLQPPVKEGSTRPQGSNHDDGPGCDISAYDLAAQRAPPGVRFQGIKATSLEPRSARLCNARTEMESSTI